MKRELKVVESEACVERIRQYESHEERIERGIEALEAYTSPQENLMKRELKALPSGLGTL